jgi:multidrug efflux system outer membrane protein
VNRHARPRAGRLALAIAAPLLLAGCAVGPDYVRPELASDVPTAFAAAEAPIDSTLVPAAWWRALGDPDLDRLVDQALAGNLSLQSAVAAVLEADALAGGARSERWPSVDLGASASRSQRNLSGFGIPRSLISNSYDASATASYELDLWGRLARADEAARATLLAREADRRVVVQTLVADVVRTWLQIRELQCQLGLNLRTAASYRRTVDTVEERFASGVAPALEVRLARQNLLAAEAAVPEVTRQLRDAVRRLEVLAGEYPAATILPSDEATVTAAVMPDPLPPVPVGLPSDLLARRPDLVAAEAGLHATVANVGAAKARLYPTISLTGSAGYNSTELDTWFDSTSDVWSLVGNLVMPLINRGATKAQVRAAEARAQQAVAAYRLAVLSAFAEVESALDADRFQARREDTLIRSVREAGRSLELADRRYRAGLDNLLSTLESQRRLLNAESQLLSTQRARRAARVDLILALGGPWDLALLSPDLAAADQSEPEGETP